MKTVMVGFFIFIFSHSIQAGCNDRGCSSKIARLYLSSFNGGSVFIKPADNARGVVGCTLFENTYLTLEKTHSLFDEIYSTLLAAQIADKRVFVRIANGSANCKVSYVTIDMQ